MEAAGFYVAHNEWLPQEVYKVGHSGRLACRLQDSCYVTCFASEWSYVCTLETANKAEAERLEAEVLRLLAEFRLGQRELVRQPADSIIAAAESAAGALGLAVRKRLAPHYISSCAAAPLREYQRQAVRLTAAELAAAGRAVLQMACRSGKTRVAHEILLQYLGRGQKVLFLVPGLALLRQTVEKLVQYGLPVGVTQVGSAEGMETEAVALAAKTAQPGAGLTVSTYQSSPLLPEAYDLVVFDEGHRVCGPAAPRSFNHVLLGASAAHRLFLTATPRYDTPISMKDRALFGGVSYRYYLREGIEAGHVNDFELILLSGPNQLAAAYQHLCSRMPHPKLLVFARTIQHAIELCDTPTPWGASPPQTLVAHSKQPPASVARILDEFMRPGRAAVLYNCRLFQEGVEIPMLNAVYFAAPRHSPRDIIQSLCRPLNRAAGKGPSTVFLPAEPGSYSTILPFVDALASEDPRFYEYLLNEDAPYPIGWVGAHGSAEALLAAARRLRALARGPRGDRLTRPERLPWAVAFAELKRTVEVCGRYVKTNDGLLFGSGSAGVPLCFYGWYRWAAEAYKSYKAGRRSPLEPYQVADLETLRDWPTRGVDGPYPWGESMAFLEAWLEQNGGKLLAIEIHRGGWIGLDATPMERLSGALTTVSQRDGRSFSRGRPRARGGFMLAESQAADLDRIFGRWGLRWRKDRDAAGVLQEDAGGAYCGRRTCIQEAYEAFKRLDPGCEFVQTHWPCYPRKHEHQEHEHVWAAGLAPPRYSKKKLHPRGPI